ncbi:MAG TPA: cytidine deaminase, partial [Clostridia bacterium]|nr:cytidine deaminase [Clostridia bacterium]
MTATTATLNERDRDALLQKAQEASERAYAPFSKFFVGAALLTAGGELYSGCNVENSSYGLTNCAERTAIFTAIADGAGSGKLEIAAIAVVNRDGVPCAPCGACRQVIFEFGPNAVVIYKSSKGEITQT